MHEQGGPARDQVVTQAAVDLADHIARECRPRLTLGEAYYWARRATGVVLVLLLLAAWVAHPHLWALNLLASVSAVFVRTAAIRWLNNRFERYEQRLDRPLPFERLGRVERETIRIETRQKWVFAALGAVAAVVTGVIVAAVRFYYFE